MYGPFVVLLALVPLLSSVCSGVMIDHVTGCPRTDARFTYDCQGGMRVTITSLSPDFHDWAKHYNDSQWGMQVDRLPCANNTVLNDYQAACDLPNIAGDGNNTPHELDLMYATDLSSTNVFFADAGGGGTTGGSSGDTVLGMSSTAAVVVLIVVVVGVLAAIAVLLRVCRSRLTCCNSGWLAARRASYDSLA